MTLQIPKRTVPWQYDAPWGPVEPAFHSKLRECAGRRGVREDAERAVDPESSNQDKLRKPRPGAVARAAGLLQGKPLPAPAKAPEKAAGAVSATETPKQPSPVNPKPAIKPKAQQMGILARIWSSVQIKYSIAGKKRLRVAELTSLGDKRFVALVTVEGREFLIGGGTGGVSLLTPISSAPVSATEIRSEMNEAGDLQ